MRARSAGAATIVAATTAISCYWRARYVNPYRPVLEHVDLSVPPGAEALKGMRLGFISDLHAGPFFDAADVARATALLRVEAPDAILLGGDYISESPRHLELVVPALARLCAATTLGGYAVLGNHDIFVSAARVTAALEHHGITVLRNCAVPLVWNSTELWLAGIDDTLHGAPDLDLAFSTIPPGAPSLALWHEPEFAEESARFGAFAQLSGHTHGGQLRLPLLRPAWLPRHGRRFTSGMHLVSGLSLYTSRGAGVYRPPVRLNCPPEVTLFTLA